MAPSQRKPASFVHLRVKSAYSLLEGAVRPKDFAKLALKHAMPAVAVTDVNNLFGVFEISETLAKDGVQPIVGCLLAVELGEEQPLPRPHAPAPAAAAAAGAERDRLQEPLQAAQRAYLGAEPGDWPHVKAELLAAHSDGLIALTGGPGGPLNRLAAEGQPEAAAVLVDRLAAIFPNRLYVELQRHGLPEERAAEDTLVDLAYGRKLPLVATNDVHFGEADMYEAHDALLCIADGTYVSQTDRRRLTREHRFKSPAEMAAQFADIPEAIENTSKSPAAAPSAPASAIPSCRNSCRNPPLAGRGIARAGRSRPRPPPEGARPLRRRESLPRPPGI